MEKELATLKQQLIVPETGITDLTLEPGIHFAAVDVQYMGEKAFVAFAVYEWEKPDGQVFISLQTAGAPYQPGFFAFREGPVIISGWQALLQTDIPRPDFLIIDGHGTAHPRKMGLASWVGIKLEIPAFGIAKDPLLRQAYTLNEDAGAFCEVMLDGETVGYVARTQTGVKPVFVSAGHKISQKTALDITFRLRGKYRVIEPLRMADQAVRKAAREYL